jgi:hypothetical protein
LKQEIQDEYHPDPIVMKRCETILLRAKGLWTQQICELTGQRPNTIRNLTPLSTRRTGGNLPQTNVEFIDSGFGIF